MPSRHEPVRASTTPRHHQFPLCLDALGHSTVSTPSSKVDLSVDPSVVLNALMSARHWAQFFRSRPGPGCSPPAIVPNITRWVSRSFVGQPLICRPLYGSRKEEASFAGGFSTLPHCAFLRALVYDMRWSVRCRRWKPMIHRRRMWCAGRSSAKCSWPRQRRIKTILHT